MLTETNYASVKLFHASGAIVTIPLPTDGSSIGPDVASALHVSLSNLLNAGFVVTEADRANADEADICAVVRGQVTNERNQTTDRIYMYSPRLKYKALTVYMNDATDIQKFEHYSGLKIADLPIIEGKAAPEQDDSVYKTKARAVSFKVLRKKGGPNDDPKESPWKLVRYVGSATVPGGVPDPSGASDLTDDQKRFAANAREAQISKAMAAAFAATQAGFPGPAEGRKTSFRNLVERLQSEGKIADVTSGDQIVTAVKFELDMGLRERAGGK